MSDIDANSAVYCTGLHSAIPRTLGPVMRRVMFGTMALGECRPVADFVSGEIRAVRIMDDPYRSGQIEHLLTAPYGVVDPGTGFAPHFTPAEMLALGVFEGRYLNSLFECFPLEWWHEARVSIHDAVPALNHFGVKSRISLHSWRCGIDGIRSHDPRGWFEWYCFYFLGRRIRHYDDWQIARWRSFARHRGGLLSNLRQHKSESSWYDRAVYPVRRQALLQWAYDPLPPVV